VIALRQSQSGITSASRPSAALVFLCGSKGYSLLEVTFALGLIVTAGAVASAQLLSAVDDVRAEGAVRYLAARLHQVRMEAVARSADVALQFIPVNGGYTYAAYVDGNGNGVRTSEIQDGTDSRIAAGERLPDRYSGVEFGLLPGLPAVDPGGSAPGTDPIRLGSSNILTFTAIGNSSSGSLYVLGRRQKQFVVRVFGETGKTRVLRFDLRTQRWKPL
jgi:type II secretory pathway pseudopilin PulG